MRPNFSFGRTMQWRRETRHCGATFGHVLRRLWWSGSICLRGCKSSLQALRSWFNNVLQFYGYLNRAADSWMSTKSCRAEELLDSLFTMCIIPTSAFATGEITSSVITSHGIVAVESPSSSRTSPGFLCCTSSYRQSQLVSSLLPAFRTVSPATVDVPSFLPFSGISLLAYTL